MIYRFALVCVLAVPAYLAAQKVDVEFDQTVDFTQFKTFMIRDGQINSQAAALNNDIIRKQIPDQMRQRLIEKKLMEVTSQPDLNVRYTLGSGRRKEVDVYPAGWYGLGTRRVVRGYTQGTLIIDLRDAKKQALVWRTITVEDKDDPPKIAGKLNDMVKKAFDKYPPKK